MNENITNISFDMIHSIIYRAKYLYQSRTNNQKYIHISKGFQKDHIYLHCSLLYIHQNCTIASDDVWQYLLDMFQATYSDQKVDRYLSI